MIFPEETHVEQNISCQLFKLNVEHDPQSLHVFCQLYRDQTTLQSQISETLLSPRRFMREALRNCMRIEGWNIFKRKIRGELWSRQSCQCALIGTCLYLLRNLPLSPLQISGLAGLNMEIWRTADQFVWDERLLPVRGNQTKWSVKWLLEIKLGTEHSAGSGPYQYGSVGVWYRARLVPDISSYHHQSHLSSLNTAKDPLPELDLRESGSRGPSWWRGTWAVAKLLVKFDGGMMRL